MRHGSLHMNVVYKCSTFRGSKYIIRRDILDQKIHEKLKKFLIDNYMIYFV